MLGTLTQVEIETLLHGAVVGRIGYQADGKVYIVPVSYAYDGRRIVCHGGHGHKIDTMRQSPDVCFEVDEVTDLANWRSVVAWGRFVELDSTEAAAGIGLLVDRLLPFVTSSSMPTGHKRSLTPHSRQSPGSESVVYAIELREKSGRFERSSS